MSTLASGPFLDWEEMTGQSKFLVDIISIPIFSAIAGLLTNWTGVLMMFVPVRFVGFWCPGLATLFPFFHPKVQVLPIFAPDGIIGFQGFIPSRSEKMASICVDKAISRIGNMKDFFLELDPDGVAEYVADFAKPQIRSMVTEIMEREHPDLWDDLPSNLKQVVFERIEAELPAIAKRAMSTMGDNIDQLLDIKLFVIGFLKRRPEIMKEMLEGMAAPELRFMVRVGLMGFPFGILLALYLQVHHHIPIWGEYISPSVMVLLGAAVIGVTVNVIAIKVVFEPGEPQPRYKYLWKQARLAKRQREAAADFGHAFAFSVLTLPNIADELLKGPRADRTMGLIDHIIADELNRVLGQTKSVVRTAVGAREFDAILAGAPGSALEFAPKLMDDPDFNKAQSTKIDKFAAEKLGSLPPGEFMELMYAAIEQDAWLLYVHGGLMGIIVGAIHLLIFGA